MFKRDSINLPTQNDYESQLTIEEFSESEKSKTKLKTIQIKLTPKSKIRQEHFLEPTNKN